MRLSTHRIALGRRRSAAFEAAGLPYFNPHSFRDTLVQLGEQRCATPEQLKAWSQNLGHDRVMTTLTSYGNVAAHRQAALIRGMDATNAAPAIDPAMMPKPSRFAEAGRIVWTITGSMR